LALTPDNGAKFFKCDVEFGTSWTWNESIKVANVSKGGFLYNLSNIPPLINDKFFVPHNIGYTALGWTEPPLQDTDMKEWELLYDDLGSNWFINNTFRVEFLKIPFLHTVGIKTIWYFDAIYYPHQNDNETVIGSILKWTRLSHGFGLAY